MVLYRWGARRRGLKDRKTQKSKWLVLAQPPYSTQGNRKQSPCVEHGTRGIDHLTRRRSQGGQARPCLLTIEPRLPQSLIQSISPYWGWGESGFNCWGVRGPTLVLFLFYVNVSGIRPRSRFSSRPLTIPAPWVLLRVRWFIRLVPWFHPE